MRSEFEEKQFEQHINMALADAHHLIYPPGQSLEFTLGFDSALFTRNRDFWRLFGSPAFGTPIDSQWWSTLDNSLHLFPPFTFNVFLQCKRPEFINSNRGREWSNWRQSYFRYQLVQHQQNALENLANNTGREAIVAYACPAFHKIHELWDSIANRAIVSRTNFARAENLTGHTVYSFISPGASGIANSEQEFIDGPKFEDELTRLSNIKGESQENLGFIQETSKLVGSAISDNSDFLMKSDLLLRKTRVVIDSETYHAFLWISIFCHLTNSNWFIGTPNG